MTDHLRQAAAERHADCERRSRVALADLIKYEQPINFQDVARAAGISTDFLYAHPQLRRRIEQHRSVGKSTAPPTQPSDDSGASGTVRALTAQITALHAAHRADVGRLEAALAVAHGENLELRRQIAHLDDGTRQHLPNGRAEVAGDRA
jgi:hypothetical protein